MNGGGRGAACIVWLSQAYLVNIGMPHLGEEAESRWRVRIVDRELDTSLRTRGREMISVIDDSPRRVSSETVWDKALNQPRSLKSTGRVQAGSLALATQLHTAGLAGLLAHPYWWAPSPAGN